jgi:hypothetical protein
MKKKRFSSEQIVAVLKQAEMGMPGYLKGMPGYLKRELVLPWREYVLGTSAQNLLAPKP